MMLFPVPAPLDVTSVVPGETVRYPLLLLRGTTDGDGVIAGTSWKAMTRFPTAAGRFSAAVMLKPGPNFVLVQSGRGTVKVQVVYKPMRTPYAVRAVLATATDERPQEGYRERLDLGLKMLQSVCAEAMREAGFGRLTFPLELGADGKVVVHVVKLDATGDSLRSREPTALYSGFPSLFDPAVDKTAGILAFSRWDRRAKRSLGEADLGGGSLALVGGDSLGRWPSSLADIPRLFGDETPFEEGETGLRKVAWAATATGLGSLLHELGHTFGLGHSTDVRSAMLRGFDALNRRFVTVEPPRPDDPVAHPVSWEDSTHWDSWEAARLSFSPWFAPDGYHGLRFPAALPPRVTFDGDAIAVSAPYGLGVVGAVRDGEKTIFNLFKGEKTARIARSEFGSGAATLVVVDRNGNETSVALRSGPPIRGAARTERRS